MNNLVPFAPRRLHPARRAEKLSAGRADPPPLGPGGRVDGAEAFAVVGQPQGPQFAPRSPLLFAGVNEQPSSFCPPTSPPGAASRKVVGGSSRHAASQRRRRWLGQNPPA